MIFIFLANLLEYDNNSYITFNIDIFFGKFFLNMVIAHTSSIK